MVVPKGVKAGNKECGLVAGMNGGRVSGEDQMWAAFRCKVDSGVGSGMRVRKVESVGVKLMRNK
jgi:hypothetical protein